LLYRLLLLPLIGAAQHYTLTMATKKTLLLSKSQIPRFTQFNMHRVTITATTSFSLITVKTIKLTAIKIAIFTANGIQLLAYRRSAVKKLAPVRY